MNEEALKDAYNLFVQQGYKKSIDEFKQLIATNPDALKDSYNLFTQQGYNKTIDDYKTLMGVSDVLKKKEEPILPMAPQQEQVPSAIPGVQPYTGSPSEGTSLELPSPISEEQPVVPAAPVTPSYVEPTPVQPEQGPLGAFNQKITGPDYGGQLTPEEQARAVKMPQPITSVKEETPKKEKTTLESVGDWINNTAAALDRGFAQNLIGNPIKGLGTIIQGLNAKVTGTSGKEPITDALINFGNYYNKLIEELAPQDEEYKNSLSDQFAQAFGQVASLIVTGATSKLAGTAGKTEVARQTAELAAKAVPKTVGAVPSALETFGKQMSATTSVSAGLSMGQSEFERAKAAGATDAQAFEVFLRNMAVGSTLETLPVMGFLKRFEKASAGGVINYIKTKGTAGIIGGAEEFTTETLQQMYANKTAKDIYNINQDLLEGVAGSGGVGFGVGFILNAMGANAKILRKQGRENEAVIIENQIKDFENRPPNAPIPSYKLNGIKIQSPEVITTLIDNTSGPDLLKLNIEITNDPVLQKKIQDKIVTNSVKEQVREANPKLNEPSLNAITELEKELQKVEGNKTQTGKDKAAAIRAQIKDIQENQIQEEVKVATIEAEAPEITTQRADRIAELETTLAPENKTEIPVIEKTKLETELQTLKTEQDAIQEQTADESVLRSEQPQVGLQEVVEGNQGLEVAPAGTQEITPAQSQQQEIDKRKKQLEGVERVNPNAGFPFFNVGQVHNDGNKYIVSNATDNRTNPETEGVIVISKIIEPAQVDENGKMTKAATVETTIFDSKEAAQKSLQENYNKYKDIAEQNLAKAKQVSSKTQPITQIKAAEQSTPAQEASLTIQEETPAVEPIVQEEQFQPISIKDVKSDAFTKDNAIDYSEDERETDSGRTSTYLSSVTVEARNADGDPIGTITKITDEDKIFYFTAEDIDGNEINLDGFDTLGDAKKAIADSYNKSQKKEFDKEAKKKAKKIYETLPTKGLQPKSGAIQPETKSRTKPTGPAVPSRISSKREEVKSSIKRIADAGLLRSAETGKSTITEQEIDAQMALTDAMAKVWEETTGKNNFYDTFIEDVKEGDVNAIAKKGGALFQNIELPKRPITRVSLGVFELPEFQKMKGLSVAPQSISDLMKSRGKQIEKDIVSTVLSYDKYKGQKRISFDEFRDDVETQLMKLERIDTKTYASYGMDNLGDNHNYGESQTIIFNSPIDHGQYGHFHSDFTRGNLAPKTWEIRQIPNTEQYVAIDSEMPSGTPANEMSNYVGTAGPRVDVEKWINDRNSITDKEINKGLFGHIRNWFNKNTGVYTLAELQSDYFQKNKANDLYASKISQDEVNEYVNKNFRRKLDNETTEAIKKEFGIVVDYTTNADGDTIATATIRDNPNIPSDYILARNTYSTSYVPVSGFTLEDVSENQTVAEALRTLAASREVFKDTDVAARRREIVNEYEAKRLEIKKEENKYIAKRIEEIKKSEPANLMVSQFIASQKVHELRLFREALKHAADKGATELWFPTPYTLAVIEGYVSYTGNAPYEVISGDENQLIPGDTIDYGGTEMTVVESNGYSITVAPSDQVSVFDIDELRNNEAGSRMDELEYDLKRQVNDIKSITKEESEEYSTDEFLSSGVLSELKDYFENNPEEEVVSWDDIEDKVRDYVQEYYNDLGVEDLVGIAGDVYQEYDTVYAVESRRATERLGQPSEYASDVDGDNFEENLSDEQYTVVKKYESLNDMMQKMRPDAEIVTDDNDKKWIKTSITESDASNPIIAFQEEGGKIKGAIDFSNDNKASIYLFDGADISTLAHEMSGHLGRRFLEQLSMVDDNFAKDYEAAKKWAGVQDNQWSRGAEEKWARGFEKYLRTGKAPSKTLTNVFKNLRTWLTNIYKTIKGSSIDVKLTPEIVSVFDNLLATKSERGVTKKFIAEEGPTAEDLSSIEAMLDLDIEDEDNMLSILNALDKVDNAISKRLRGSANEALLAIPLSTIQVVVKALKTLVKGGMLLRDAIRKVAADNNLSQESIKDILNIAPIQEGFNSVMSKVDAMIERQKRRGVEDKKIISNVDTLVRNEEVYINADDAQKKILEREARVKLGVAPRRAPSIGRVLGALKDITNISRQEKLQVIKQIRELSRDAAKDLANEIKELAKTGTITLNQAANIIARFGKVNMLNEVSVSNFVDYMSKVFENAEYVNKIEQVNSKLKTAKKNIGTKIGTADGLILPLQRLFAINPTLIPQEFFDRYFELVTMFGEKQAVLSLEEKSAVTKDVESILTGLNEEQSKANELADRFNQFEGKVFDDEGRLQYADTINKMVEDKVIDEDEAEIMRKYKSDIAPQVGKTKMTDEQIAEEKKELIQALNKTQVDTSGLPTRYQRDLANRLKDLVSTKNVEELSNTDLKNLLKVLDNINNNYLPHYAQLMVEKLNSINDAETLTSAFKKAVIAPLSGLYSKIKSSILGSKRTAVSEMVRRNPLFYIDQIFGNFKTKDIFNAVFNKVSEAEAKFKADLKRVQNILEKAEERVAKSFNLNGNDTLMSKFKMMTYMVQLEYDSNQGSKQVNPAADYLRATIKHIDEGKSQFGERDANMLQQILKEFAPNGEINNDKLYNSFNKAEKSAIKDIRGVNESLREKAEDTAAIIRGDRINPLTNYVHLNVLHEHQPNDLTSGVAFVNDYNNSMRGSTKAKSLIERTGKVSPLNFDVFASAQRGAKFVLMDYNLTEPIRTARKTIKQTISNFEKEGRIPKEKRQIINAIDSAFEEATENVLTNTFVTNSLADDFVDYVNKQGYRAVLASTSRFVSELSSNIAFAVILDPKAFATGVENKGFIMSTDAPVFMENVDSKAVNRIFPTDTLSGKVIDTNILQQTSGIKGAKSKNPVANKTQQIWNLSGKKVLNTVELTADALISTPDKLSMRPMWFGSFINEFKKLTGEEVNKDKIVANDEKYMDQYKDAIEKAKTTADEKSIMMGATDNPFMGILKGTVKPDQKFLTRAFNNFNNFMTKFMIFEYVSARTGIMAAMGNGSLTKKQGVAVLGAVTTRMVVYTLMLQMLGTGLMGLIFGDGEEPEDEKSFMQKLGQAFASAFTSIALGRDFGNATKQMINIGVERVNENYLDFLREGDYDPYKDAIQYSIVPPDKEGKQTDFKDFLLNMGGAFGPALKTADLIGRKILEPKKEEDDAIERQEDEIKIRIPLEILGNLGFIPLYKDIRKVVLKNIYSSLEEAERTAADKKKAEKEKLHGYKNKSDMERYDPELWDKVYGPNSPDYDKDEAIKEIKRAKEKLEREAKDEMYNYVPKSSKTYKFGPQNSSGKSKSKYKFGPQSGTKKSEYKFGPR